MFGLMMSVSSSAHADPPRRPGISAAPWERRYVPQRPDGVTGTLWTGVFYTHAWGNAPSDGVGVQLRYSARPSLASVLQFGGFALGGVHADGTLRVSGGAHIGTRWYATEVGITHRTGSDVLAPTTSVLVGQALTYSYVSVAFRLAIPVGSEAPAGQQPTRGHGIEPSLSVSFQLPAFTHGPQRTVPQRCMRRRQ